MGRGVELKTRRVGNLITTIYDRFSPTKVWHDQAQTKVLDDLSESGVTSNSNWSSVTQATAFEGKQLQLDTDLGSAIVYTFENLRPQEDYKIYFHWDVVASNANTATDWTIEDGAGNVVATGTIDQSTHPASDVTVADSTADLDFEEIDTITCETGTLLVHIHDGDGTLQSVADAVYIELDSPTVADLAGAYGAGTERIFMYEGNSIYVGYSAEFPRAGN